MRNARLAVWFSTLVLMACLPIASRVAHADEEFCGGRALAYLADLTQDSFEGRKSGEAGGVRTEEYIARRFAEWGLQPAGGNDDFFQTFPMLATHERSAKLELPESPYGRIEFLYGDDFTFVTNSGSGDVTGEVVIVGHGLFDDSRKWNDYGDLDVRGRIVLIIRGTPENGYDWDLEATRDSTLHEAVRRGAAAVLYSQDSKPVHGGAIHAGSYFPAVPILYVSERIVDHLFQNTGRDRADYVAAIAHAPDPLATGKRLHVRTDVRLQPGASARNVIGLVPGSDPERAGEIIVVGAHMDHLGCDPNGLVYNGANDNASGAAVVMELARCFAASKPPARTILFAAFGGEEQGLLGSEAFVAQPPIDLDQVIAMINLDMVGQGDGRAGLGGGEQFPEVLQAFRAGLDSSFVDSLVIGRAWGGEGSDHAPFRRAGVPTCNVWSEGDHRFYHSIVDDYAWIDSTAVRTVGRTTARWIRALGNWPGLLSHPHREGRTLLRGSTGFDFEGAPGDGAPPWVAGAVHWFDAAEFAQLSFIDAVGTLTRAAAQTDSVQLVDELAQVSGAQWLGRAAHAMGLEVRASAAVVKNPELLRDLHVALVRFDRSPAGADSALIAACSSESVRLIIPPDSAWVSILPETARPFVRVFPGSGNFEQLAGFPRDRFFFILSLNGPADAKELAAALHRLGWDRVHLDLVPWAKKGCEEEIWPFLEELKRAGNFPYRHMRAMLGANLERAAS